MNAKNLIDSLVEEAMPVQATGWNDLLALSNALYLMYYTFHWKARGANYYGDHELYGRLYEAVQEDIDGIAEKAIGTTDDDSFITAIRWSMATAKWVNSFDPAGVNEPSEFPFIMLEAEKTYLEMVPRFKQQLEDAGLLTDGVDDALQALANKHEGHVYLLQQRRA